MEIIINYDSSWRNSFLDGSNNEPLPKKGRKFVASMTELGKEENYKARSITLDTVLGVLNRLIGDQRKLYQSQQELGHQKHYFNDITHTIGFEDNPQTISQEITYIRNMKGSTDQNSFTGLIKANDPAFQSDYSQALWGVLFLDLKQLCEFILDKTPVSVNVELEPLSILNKLSKIKKYKPVEFSGQLEIAAQQLSSQFDAFKPLNNKGQLLLLPMYCSALYLQLQQLEKIYDMSSAKSRAGGITGISKNGFTPKDFMKVYTTGSKKLIYGNPYIRETYVKGEGKIKHKLTKASGQLNIHLDISLDKAIKLKTMIEHAGVSAFYLGKKGLAYVSHMDVR